MTAPPQRTTRPPAGPTTRPLAVVASRVRLEEKLLLRALSARGVEVEVVDTRRTTFVLDALALPYCGALMREISHTRSAYAARLFEHAGVPTLNTAHAIGLCGDKLLTTLALQAAGLPVPRALVGFAPENALDDLERFGFPSVLKPVNGSWGYLAARLTDRDGAEAILEHRAALPSPQHKVVYAQEYIDKPDRDIKAYVIGGEVVGAIYKTSTEWRTNTARSGRPQLCNPDDELVKLLSAASEAVGGGVLGIDVLEDRHGGRFVNEVNHTPEFHGAIEVLPVDLVGAYVDHVVRRLAADERTPRS